MYKRQAYTFAQAEVADTAVIGQKLDSDLGSLPAYGEWHRHAQLKRLVVSDVGVVVATGEKIDSGLGNLPPYASWDRHPELRRFASPAMAGI